MKKNIDLIHIGYHKTASTWFQRVGYRSGNNIELVNDENKGGDGFFYKNFIEPSNFQFNKDKFNDEFFSKFYKKNKKFKIICDENLSGHSWTGNRSDILLERLFEVFGYVKIVIIIRRQLDMIQSLYRNYVMSGGLLPYFKLIKDINLEGHLIFEKLKYNLLIKAYQKKFKKKKCFSFAL